MLSFEEGLGGRVAELKLYTYFRSSAAYRVRIALELKGLGREDVFVNLRRVQHRAPEYLELNPQGLVPLLQEGDLSLGQSLAILEYLEETHPEPPLLPSDPHGRARIRQLALVIACEVHPLQNLGVRNYLGELGLDGDSQARWARHWIETGLTAFESLLAQSGDTGRFCHGDAPTLADVCLVPQLYNARRQRCDLGELPEVVRIDAECAKLDAFTNAAPEAQPDAHEERDV